MSRMSRSMRWLRAWSTAISLALAGAVLQAQAGTIPPARLEIPDAAAGDDLAHNLCINCHVVDKRGPVSRTDRVPSFPWIANQKGETETSITVWLSTFHERMPQFRLTDAQIRDLSTYIISLRNKGSHKP